MDNDPMQPLPEPEARPQRTDTALQLESLQRLVVSTLLLVIVVSGTLWMFLMRQVRNTNADIKVMTPPWSNAVSQFQHNAPIIQQTVTKLQDYARSHPDFAQILNKYAYATNPPAAAASAPPQKAKK